MRLPSAYQTGYDKARALNLDPATKYVEHTVIEACRPGLERLGYPI